MKQHRMTKEIKVGDLMNMNYDYMVYPKVLRGLTFAANGYLFFDTFFELHIIKNEKVYKIICDLESFDKIKDKYFAVSETDKFEKRGSVNSFYVYCYINTIRYGLKDIIFPEYSGKKIEHLNNNCFDFRKQNIRLLDRISKKQVKVKRKSKDSNLPVGISGNYSNGKLVGYNVHIGTPYAKIFLVSVYNSESLALIEALKYNNQLHKDIK